MAMITLALLLATQAAPAATPIEATLAEARARYDAVAYDDALALLEQALTQPALEAEGRARLEAFTGVVRAQMGDEAGARRSFESAAALDACVAFPDAPAPAGIRALFAAAKRERATTIAAATSTSASPASPAAPAWPLPAGLAFAAAGGVTLAAAGVVGAIAVANNAQANAARVQLDALTLDAVAREQAVVANSLAVLGAVLVIGGGATAGLGLVLE